MMMTPTLLEDIWTSSAPFSVKGPATSLTHATTLLMCRLGVKGQQEPTSSSTGSISVRDHYVVECDARSTGAAGMFGGGHQHDGN